MVNWAGEGQGKHYLDVLDVVKSIEGRFCPLTDLCLG